MKSRIVGLLAFALIGISGSAMADPTLLGTTTDPTGIDGVLVDGTLYNVTFSTTTINSPLYTQFTFGSQTSLDATTALAAALTSLGVTEFGGVPPPVGGGVILGVDNTLGWNDAAGCFHEPVPHPEEAPCSEGLWRGPFSGFPINSTNDLGFLPTNGPGSGTPLSFFGTALFAPATSVPEPTTLSLLALGLAGAGFVRRRKKSRSS